MLRLLLGASLISCFALVITPSRAEELLVSGDFEIPQGQPDFNGWTLEESVTGAGFSTIDTAEPTNAGGEDGTRGLFLKSFSGNGALDPNDGNFDNDNLPGGDVDGFDFLVWQLGGSPTPNSQTDLTTWENNYGREGGRLTNAVLSQTVPGTPGVSYSFSGSARWEPNYSGGAGTLDPTSPLGGVATPTTNNLRLQFLNAGGDVIEAHSLDLAANGQLNLDLWQQHSIVNKVAPAGTAQVRVVADAEDMVYNLDPGQSAFYDSFSLVDDADPNAEDLLTNGALDDPAPTALDFWEIFEIPSGCCSGDVLRSNANQGFANHTDDGNRGVWLSAFFGAHPSFEDDPVTGLMSQTVTAVAGGSYDFSGWAKFEQNYSGGVDTISAASPGDFAGMPSPTETLIVLEFLDPNMVVINQIIDFDPNGVAVLDPNSPNIIDIRAERQALCGGNANDESCVFAGQNKIGWTEHSLSGIIAPAGTAYARLTAGMLNGVFNIDPRQSAFFDDFSLSGPASLVVATNSVPEPSTAVGIAIGALMLSFRRNRRKTARATEDT